MTDTEKQKVLDVSVDVLIIGGGIAGLWTLARLQQAGYKTVLLESDTLGAGQTRFAQGIIHGGTKYALTGKLTASSEAVADMPARWRACYQGSGELDLSKAELLSDAHYLWSTASFSSRLSGFFASKIMRAKSRQVDKKSLPAIFQHKDFHGQLYCLDEPIFDALSVVRAIAEPRKQSILAIKQQSVRYLDNAVEVESREDKTYRFDYKKIILLAGQGNEYLLKALHCDEPSMQLRPLKMVVMRSEKLNDRVYAHCLGASVNPRITITSHYDSKGNIVWYMGGQLAESGVTKTDVELIEAAKSELSELMPWLELDVAQWGVLEVDRAEIKLPSKAGGAIRPDSFSIEQNNNVITAWPTKMALSPALADALLKLLEQQNIEKIADDFLPEWKSAEYADFPWNEKSCWQRGEH
jgi:glycerol-3-phosphate dehydrogenase